jgi:hypothetical protein
MYTEEWNVLAFPEKKTSQQKNCKPWRLPSAGVHARKNNTSKGQILIHI